MLIFDMSTALKKLAQSLVETKVSQELEIYHALSAVRKDGIFDGVVGTAVSCWFLFVVTR